MTQITPDQLPIRYRLMRRGLQALSYTVPPVASRVALDMFSTPTRRPARSGKTKRVLARAQTTTIPYIDPDMPAWTNLTITVRTWGDPAHPRVILVHGWEGQAGSYRDFVGPLTDAGFYAVAFDVPGHGESTGDRANLLVFMNALRAVVAEVGQPVAVVGHSLGGIAALLAHGEEPRVPAEKIVTIAAPQVVTGAFESFAAFWGLPEHILRGMYDIISEQVGRTVSDFTVANVADNSTARVLVVHDTDDTDVPYHNAEAIRDALPNVTVHKTSGLGHQLILRDADVVAQVVAFLAED